MLSGDAMWSGLSPSGAATPAGGQPRNTVRMWVGACRGVAERGFRERQTNTAGQSPGDSVWECCANGISWGAVAGFP